MLLPSLCSHCLEPRARLLVTTAISNPTPQKSALIRCFVREPCSTNLYRSSACGRWSNASGPCCSNCLRLPVFMGSFENEGILKWWERTCTRSACTRWRMPRKELSPVHRWRSRPLARGCLLYTSDAADDPLCVDLGGRRIIKKKSLPIDAGRHARKRCCPPAPARKGGC